METELLLVSEVVICFFNSLLFILCRLPFLQTALPEQEGPSDGSFPTIEVFSSREMAYHMTLYDWELFSCVQEVGTVLLSFVCANIGVL